MLFGSTDNFAGLPERSWFTTKTVICSFLMIHDRETLASSALRWPEYSSWVESLLVKDLDSSFHIIRHFRHNDKPSTCLNVKWTSEWMISLQQAMQAAAETGVWRGKNRVVLHAVKIAFWQARMTSWLTTCAFIYQNCDILVLWFKSTI